MTTEFLPEPRAIRAALAEALEHAAWLDAAVGFIGADWGDIICSEVLRAFRRPPRVVCWLSSTNTNPYAVEQMVSAGIRVRQRDAMHAKVYVCGGRSATALVGSANLSSAALAHDDALGQVEAGAVFKNPARIRQIQRWFNALWANSRQLAPHDLQKAKIAWIAAHRDTRSERRGSKRGHQPDTVSRLPANWKPSRKLVTLANCVKRWDPALVFNDYLPILRRVARTGASRDLERLIQCVSEWTGHRGIYYPSLDEPGARVRAAFTTIFDQARPLRDRLRKVGPGGSKKLAGFSLMSLTLLLYWRYPRDCPPFNRRSLRFLKDHGLDRYLRVSVSADQYDEWVHFAQDLAERLRLPSAGHVDRLVWEYTKDLDI